MNPPSRGGGRTASSFRGPELGLAAGLPTPPLRELLRAAWYAQDTGRSAWDFATSMTLLVSHGLSECDLRWLSCKGFLQHAVVLVHKDGSSRTIQKTQSVQFAAGSSFVLTPKGTRFVGQLLSQAAPQRAEWDVARGGLSCQRASNHGATSVVRIPCWNSHLRELRVDTVLIKRFCVPAENQELILASFQEEAWPARIDDPLPPVPQIDAKRRLHSAIQCLNRNQRAQLVHFHGDGNGRGVRWEMPSSSSGRVSSAKPPT